MLEMALSIIVVSLPGLKPLLGSSHKSNMMTSDAEQYHEEPKRTSV